MSMSLFDSSLPLTPPSTPRRGPVPLPDVDGVKQDAALCMFPAGNALGLFVYDPTLPNGGNPMLAGARRWTYAAQRKKIKKVRLRRNGGRQPSYLDAFEDTSAHVPSVAAASATATDSNGQNAQDLSHYLPQPVTSATTGEAGSA